MTPQNPPSQKEGCMVGWGCITVAIFAIFALSTCSSSSTSPAPSSPAPQQQEQRYDTSLCEGTDYLFYDDCE